MPTVSVATNPGHLCHRLRLAPQSSSLALRSRLSFRDPFSRTIFVRLHRLSLHRSSSVTTTTSSHHLPSSPLSESPRCRLPACCRIFQPKTLEDLFSPATPTEPQVFKPNHLI
ncbi:hypothetical protein U1Q18_007326 [Sarracenia purpurea var. burkii]